MRFSPWTTSCGAGRSLRRRWLNALEDTPEGLHMLTEHLAAPWGGGDQGAGLAQDEDLFDPDVAGFLEVLEEPDRVAGGHGVDVGGLFISLGKTSYDFFIERSKIVNSNKKIEKKIEQAVEKTEEKAFTGDAKKAIKEAYEKIKDSKSLPRWLISFLKK